MNAQNESSRRHKVLTILTGLGVITFGLLWEFRWQRLIRSLSLRDRYTQQWIDRALHDPLTNLPNRTLLQDRIEQALIRARRNGTSIAILFIDLDDFKNVNDEFGHMVGDRLLVAVGERFQQHLRASDTAARLGGDEFVVLLEVSNGHEGGIIVADRLRTALQVPLLLEPEPITLNASIGVTVADAEYHDAETLLNEADQALLEAKRRGKNQVVLAQMATASAIAGNPSRW